MEVRARALPPCALPPCNVWRGGAATSHVPTLPTLLAPSLSADAATDLIVSVFEDDASSALHSAIAGVFPWAFSASEIQTGRTPRLFDDKRDSDIFFYTYGDRLTSSTPDDDAGVAVIVPRNDDFLKALPAVSLPSGVPFSPANSDPPFKHPPKYVIGEAYGGDKDDARRDKVRQLETLVAFALKRWLDQQPKKNHLVTDCTSVIGAALLVFNACDVLPSNGRLVKRKAVLNKIVSYVSDMVTAMDFPNLHRLARARRLLVVVLSKHQASATFSIRALANLQHRVTGMEAPLVTVAADLRTLIERSNARGGSGGGSGVDVDGALAGGGGGGVARGSGGGGGVVRGGGGGARGVGGVAAPFAVGVGLAPGFGGGDARGRSHGGRGGDSRGGGRGGQSRAAGGSSGRGGGGAGHSAHRGGAGSGGGSGAGSSGGGGRSRPHKRRRNTE